MLIYGQYVLVTSEKLLQEERKKAVVQGTIHYHQLQNNYGQWFRSSVLYCVKLKCYLS